MPAPRDSLFSSAAAEPTLVVTPPGATPAHQAIDPNAPTVIPAAPGVTRPAVARPPRIDEPPAPAKIGRFTVLRELGRGGTGVVYAAYDEQLDRKVAVKLLHSETREELARTRLLREAQAMARLSHPNIVGVHEVGTHGAQIYVAMEFVHGMTLHAWLKRQRRTFPEIAAMFRQAGQGLLAAHQAGLVHRDFKPANVMVGHDGRVRVLDFGLARAEAEPGAAPGLDHLGPAPEHTSHVANLRSLDASITVTGVMLGTPAYMSPEQFLGARVDPRSDQFSFCVALFEAAYRERPFHGDTLAELMTTVLAGHVRDVSTPAGVPRALRPLLVRGLAREPTSRWPDMHVLLTELARFARPPARRSWLAAAAFAATLTGGGVGLAYQSGMIDQACTGGAAELAQVWSPEVTDRLRAAARAAAVPGAEAVYDRTLAALDRYGADWLAGYADACGAAADELDLRMTCLGERRRAFAAAVDTLASPDEQLVARAGELVANLPRVDACADGAYLRAKVRPPDDPEVAARVEDLRGELDRAANLDTAGKLADALAVLAPLADRAPRNYPPLLAELALRRGATLDNDGRYLEARQALEDAFFTGVEAGHLEVAVDAATRLAYLVGRRLRDGYAAKDWLEHAEIYAVRLGEPIRRARVLTVRGGLANLDMDPALAQKSLTEALRLYHEAGAEDTTDFARALRFYGDHLAGSGRVQQGIATQERALEIMRRLLGPQHPDVAMIHNSLGIALKSGDKAQKERALAVFREALDAAVDLPRQRSHIYMTLWANTAFVLEELDRHAEAEAPLRESIAVLERSSPRMLPDTYYMRIYLSTLLNRLGREAEAEAELRDDLADAEQLWGPNDYRLGDALLNLSASHLETGDVRGARAVAERALDLVGRGPAPYAQSMVPAAKWHLARALAKDGEPERAAALAREARAYAVTERKDPKMWIQEIDAFLTQLATREGGAP